VNSIKKQDRKRVNVFLLPQVLLLLQFLYLSSARLFVVTTGYSFLFLRETICCNLWYLSSD